MGGKGGIMRGEREGRREERLVVLPVVPGGELTS